MERCLVSVRTVWDIVSIPGADNIELAKIDGWQCVIKKGEFRVFDKCVFCEIDSFLPVMPMYEFLRKSSYRRMGDAEGFRIKTIKLKGQVSQGLALPMSMFPKLDPSFSGDLSEFLGVVKYEKPEPLFLTGNRIRSFPEFVPKTGQERIQNLWYSDKLNRDGPYEVTVKLDGTSFTAYWNGARFGVCSRNTEIEEDDSLYWRIARKYELREILSGLGDYAIQGEIIGPGVQGNTEKLDELGLYVYDIYNIKEQHYLDPTMRLFHENVLNRVLAKRGPVRLNSVPFVGITTLDKFSLHSLLEYADGTSLNPDVTREGVVFRSLKPQEGMVNSFKVINNKFLLKEQ